jgi:ribosomal protein S12 methylthiotransferase
LVDDLDEQGIIARSKADAPEVDGLVYVQSEAKVNVGDFIEVEITDSSEHDLYARQLT